MLWISTINHAIAIVPFDEDERDRSVWFLDHDYLENMAAMFKKVNCKYMCVYLVFIYDDLLPTKSPLPVSNFSSPLLSSWTHCGMVSHRTKAKPKWHCSTPAHRKILCKSSEWSVVIISWVWSVYVQVLVIVDAKPKALGLPTDAYYAVEEVHDVRHHSSWAFHAIRIHNRIYLVSVVSVTGMYSGSK